MILGEESETELPCPRRVFGNPAMMTTAKRDTEILIQVDSRPYGPIDKLMDLKRTPALTRELTVMATVVFAIFQDFVTHDITSHPLLLRPFADGLQPSPPLH